MYKANISVGWIKDWYEGEDATEIICKVEKIQDFDCLIRMGRMQETKEGQKELDKLETFVKKYYAGNLTIDDVKELDIRLSIGDIVCNEIVEVWK